MAARYLLPALAVAGRAVAEVCSGTTTINSQAEATQLATCEQFNGDIWIAPGTVGDIDLTGIQRIEGSLLAKNVPQMSSLTASTLSIISNTFGLETISSLTSLNFPSLVEVDTIKWIGLPSLQGLSFTQQVQKASVLDIQNTYLANLEGIDLQMIDTLYIANNRFLTQVDMQLGNCTKGMVFSSNGNPLSVSFPNLIWGNDMIFINVSSLSLPSLASVNGSLGMRSNYFESFTAPNLTLIRSSLSFISNVNLKSFSFPELKEIIGGIAIANNTKLMTVDGFPRLTDVFGAIDMFGTFTSVKLPSIKLVRGAFNIYSSNNIKSSCDHFASLEGADNVIQGTPHCESNIDSAAHGGTGSGGSGTTGGTTGGGSSGANSLLIPYASGIIGLVAAVFGML